MPGSEQRSWWKRAGARVISWLNPLNAASFLTAVVANAIQYFSTQSAATDPGYYGIDPHHADRIMPCLDINLLPDSKYEGLRTIFQNGWLQLPVVFCVVISAGDVINSIQHRRKNARWHLEEFIRKEMEDHKKKAMVLGQSKSTEHIDPLVEGVTQAAIMRIQQVVDYGETMIVGVADDQESVIAARRDYRAQLKHQMEATIRTNLPPQTATAPPEPIQLTAEEESQAREMAAATSIFTRDYWYGFFRDSRGKFSFPYKEVIHPAFCLSLLWYVFGGRHFANEYDQDIPVEFDRLMHDNATNWQDEACLNITAMHDAGDANLTNAVIYGLLIPALAIGSIVTAIEIRKAYRLLTDCDLSKEYERLTELEQVATYGTGQEEQVSESPASALDQYIAAENRQDGSKGSDFLAQWMAQAASSSGGADHEVIEEVYFSSEENNSDEEEEQESEDDDSNFSPESDSALKPS